MRGRSDDPEIYRWKRTIASLVSLSRSSRLASSREGASVVARVFASLDPSTHLGSNLAVSLLTLRFLGRHLRRSHHGGCARANRASLVSPRSPTLAPGFPQPSGFPRPIRVAPISRAATPTSRAFARPARRPRISTLHSRALARPLPSRALRARPVVAPPSRSLASPRASSVFGLRVSRAHLSSASSSPTWLSRSL